MTVFTTIQIFRRNIGTKYPKPYIRYIVIGLTVFRTNIIMSTKHKPNLQKLNLEQCCIGSTE